MMNPIAYGVRAGFLAFISLVLLVWVLTAWEHAIGFIIFLSAVCFVFVVIIYLFKRQVLRQHASKLGLTSFLVNMALVVSIISAITPWAKLFMN